MMFRKIMIGDIVELLPINNRARQLRKQHGFIEWEVVGIREKVICLDGQRGFDIKALGSSKSRWVTEDEIEIVTFRENRDRN
jgi:hypothetical protein